MRPAEPQDLSLVSIRPTIRKTRLQSRSDLLWRHRGHSESLQARENLAPAVVRSAAKSRTVTTYLSRRSFIARRVEKDVLTVHADAGRLHAQAFDLLLGR